MYRFQVATKELLTLLICLFFLLVSTPRWAAAVPAEGHRLMIAGPSPHAVAVGLEISKAGGNVVDASIAIALSLAVTHPYYAGFGGGGFALVKQQPKQQSKKDLIKVEALDFREMAPQASTADMFQKGDEKSSINGGLAVGVPGLPSGYWELHQKYGKLKWQTLFSGAMRLAEEGFPVSGEWVRITARNQKRFNATGQKLFFKKNGDSLKPGEIFRQPQLGKFLREYSRKGPGAFYSGRFANDLVKTVSDAGGVMKVEDLTKYKVRWLEPLRAEFAGHQLYLMPPPSSGGVVIAQAVQLIEKLKVTEKEALSADEFHLLIEIMKLSYRGRSLLGDPDFTKNPIEKLTDPAELAKLAALIKSDKALDIDPLIIKETESENTTHFSVMDASGNTVAMTITLNGDYGSGLVTPISGIALNNEMDDFTSRPGQPNMFGLVQGKANQVRAGARPLSSMSPTIVEKDGKTVMSLGAPGGPRIISSVLQVIYRSLVRDFNVEQAIQAPRVHHQFQPNVVTVDPHLLPPESINALKSRGHQIRTGSTGKVYAITRDEENILRGAADSRGEAAAGGN